MRDREGARESERGRKRERRRARSEGGGMARGDGGVWLLRFVVASGPVSSGASAREVFVREIRLVPLGFGVSGIKVQQNASCTVWGLGLRGYNFRVWG